MSNLADTPLNKKVASIILAGGLGTRLHPLTLHRCKPAVCFAGRYRLIDVPISNSLNSKISQIFVISQYFASHLQRHLVSAYPHNVLQNGNLEMLCPETTPLGMNWFLGTADAVRKNIDAITHSNWEYFLILSGDQLYNIDLMKMAEFAVKKDAELVVAALPVQAKDASRMGLLKISTDHEIVDFIEKPKDPALLEKFCFCSVGGKTSSCYLGSMGIYVFKKEALFELLEKEGDDFGKDLIPIQVKKGKSYAFVYEGYWEDIGTVESYYQANLSLIDEKKCLDIDNPENPIYTKTHQLPSPKILETEVNNSIISQGCLIKAKEVNHSVIGLRTSVGQGTVIKDSIVIGNHEDAETLEASFLKIGDNCIIEKSIIDEGCSIGNDVILKNTKSLQSYDGDGIFIRDGIIIVASGTKLPDGFTL